MQWCRERAVDSKIEILITQTSTFSLTGQNKERTIQSYLQQKQKRELLLITEVTPYLYT